MKNEYIKLHYKDKHICNICGRQYCYANKSHHNKTAYHKLAMLLFEEKLKNRI